jgi:acyl dehydratase
MHPPDVADHLEAWEALIGAVGAELGVSPPQRIDQRMVDEHSATTGDAQWIHDDTERARTESPFGGPIVQGFLLLSLLTRHSSSFRFPDFGPMAMMVNYGLDRVRFIAPVPVGAAVQVRATLGEVRPKDDQRAVVGVDLVVEMIGDEGPTPAVVARWLFLAVR